LSIKDTQKDVPSIDVLKELQLST